MTDAWSVPPEETEEARIEWDRPSYGLRRRRLADLLPDLYAQQSPGSLVGRVISGMAYLLAGFDADAQKVLRDRWVVSATGGSPPRPEGSTEPGGSTAEGVPEGGGRSPLERLGTLLALPRLDGEDAEAYRHRLRIAAPVLVSGSCSPRAVLDMAIAALGLEPCGLKERAGNLTMRWGVPPGAPADCPVCRRGRADGNEGEGEGCPNRGAGAVTVTLIEHPVRAQSRTLPGLRSGARFRLGSGDGASRRPEIRIAVTGGRLVNPAMRNTTTRETMVFDGVLETGEQLVVWPPAGETKDPDAPAGNTALRIGTDGKAVEVSGRIVCATVFTFGNVNEPTRADPRFTASAQTDQGPIRFADFASGPAARVLTPILRSPADLWQLGAIEDGQMAAFRSAGLSGALPEPVAAPDGPDASPPAVDLTFSWRAPQPGSFVVVIAGDPEIPALAGRRALVRDSVMRVRPAGVTALLEYAAALPADRLVTNAVLTGIAAAFPREAIPLGDGGTGLGVALTDRIEPSDRPPTANAVFDIAHVRFDNSHFN